MQLVVVAGLLATSCAYVQRVSVSETGGDPLGGDSQDISLSADGRFAAFASFANNLVANDTNNDKDIFVRDNLNGTTELVSVSMNGGVPNGLSGQPDISADGRWVVYWSFATDIVANDTNNASDVFIYDRQTGTTELVSVTTDEQPASAGALGGSVSDDGRRVAFYSLSQLTSQDTNNEFDVYFRDRQIDSTILVSRNPAFEAVGSSFDPVISRDGTMVAWWSGNDGTTADDTNGFNDVFVRSTLSGIGVMVSYDQNVQGANGHSYLPDISDDGSVVVFHSDASDLVAGDTEGQRDVFRREVLLNSTTRLSENGAGGNGASFNASIDGAGDDVVFLTATTNLTGIPDGNGAADALWWNGSALARISETSDARQLNGNSVTPDLSQDGTAVGFGTTATNIGFADGNSARDVVIRPTFVPRIDLVSGPLTAGQTTTLTFLGDFSDDPMVIVGGPGVVSTVVTSSTPTQIFAEVTLDATAPPQARDLWVIDPAPQLGYPAPLGAGDRTALSSS